MAFISNQQMEEVYKLHRLHFLLLFIFFILSSGSSSSDCNKPRRDWMNFRYQALIGTPPLQISNPPFSVCPIPDGRTCCDSQMESDIYALSNRQLANAFTKWLKSVSQQMESDAMALNYYFRSNLKEARDRLHDTFSGIYGYTYKRNHAFFFSLFSNLDEYLAGQQGNLRQLMDTFFADLRTSIVALMEDSSMPMPAGGSSSIDSMVSTTPEWARIKCLAAELGKHNAFDGVDVRIRSRFLEAYPPARMLVNSLATSSRLLASISNEASVRPECVIAYSRLQYCGSYCAARDTRRSEVCPSVCDRFIPTCFGSADRPSNLQFPAIWQKLIDSIAATTTRLERSFNFPVVNNELHMSLSEAITFVQSKYPQVKSLLEQECKSGRSTNNQRAHPAQQVLNSPYQNQEVADWPYSRSLRKRSAEDNTTDKLVSRPKRQYASSNQQSFHENDPPASPEFLNWQKNKFPISQSSQQSQKFNRDGSKIDKNNYSRRRPIVAPTSLTSNQDRLTKWLGQLKSYYSAQRNLLQSPPDLICRKASPSTSDCYNPPPIEEPKLSREIQASVDNLGECATRLQASTVTDGDPEALEIGVRLVREATANKANSSSSQPPSLFPQPTLPDSYRPVDINQLSNGQRSYSNNDAYRPPNQNYPGFSDQIESSGFDSPPIEPQGAPFVPQPPQSQYPPYQPTHIQSPPVNPLGVQENQVDGNSYAPKDWESSGMEPPLVQQPLNQPEIPPPAWQETWRPGSPGDQNKQEQFPNPDPQPWQPPANQWQPQPDIASQKEELPSLGGDFESSGIGIDSELGQAVLPQPDEGRSEDRFPPSVDHAFVSKTIPEYWTPAPVKITNATHQLITTTPISHTVVPEDSKTINQTTPLLQHSSQSTVSPSSTSAFPVPPIPVDTIFGRDPHGPPVGGLPDDEDFSRSQFSSRLPAPSQSGAENVQPSWPEYDRNLQPPAIPEASGYLPPEPVIEPPGRGDSLPDCSTANAGSGLDPRCLQNPNSEFAPMPPNSIDSGELDRTPLDIEGSGEYAPGAIGEYPGPNDRRIEDERGTYFNPDFNQRPDANFDKESNPVSHTERDRSFDTDVNVEVNSATGVTKSPITEPPMELPQGVWLPAPEYRPDNAAGSQLFLPMYSKVQSVRQKFQTLIFTSLAQIQFSTWRIIYCSTLLVSHGSYSLYFV